MNPLSPTVAVLVADESHPIRSRWGYHVCGLQLYEKVRLLNYLCTDSEKLAMSRVRFDRKLLNNAEAVWEKVRNDKGQPCGWKLIEGAKNVRPPVTPVPCEYVLTWSIRKSHTGRGWRMRAGGPYFIVGRLWNQVKVVSPVPVFAGKDEAADLIKAQVLLDPLVEWYRENRPAVLKKFRDKSVPKH